MVTSKTPEKYRQNIIDYRNEVLKHLPISVYPYEDVKIWALFYLGNKIRVLTKSILVNEALCELTVKILVRCLAETTIDLSKTILNRGYAKRFLEQHSIDGFRFALKCARDLDIPQSEGYYHVIIEHLSANRKLIEKYVTNTKKASQLQDQIERINSLQPNELTDECKKGIVKNLLDATGQLENWRGKELWKIVEGLCRSVKRLEKSTDNEDIAQYIFQMYYQLGNINIHSSSLGLLQLFDQRDKEGNLIERPSFKGTGLTAIVFSLYVTHELLYLLKRVGKEEKESLTALFNETLC